MIDFVHLNWISYKKEQPKNDDIYLFLVKEKKTGKVFVQSIAYMADKVLSTVFGGTDDHFELIAWADAEMITFDCDPEKLHKCNNKDKECTFSNDCSTCTLTTNIEDAKWISWFR